MIRPALFLTFLTFLTFVAPLFGAESEVPRSEVSGIELPLPEVPVSKPAKGRYTGKSKWTMYYIADVKAPAKTGSGKGETVELLDGSKVKYWWGKSDSSKIRMEATASIVEENGEQQTITRVGPGQWQAIPAEHFAKGNRQNMLFPWVHLAADQSIYRFGSRVYCKLADGQVTPDGKVHDGFFWIADTGGRIKGSLRFDLFVGRSNMYMEMMNRDRHPAPEVVIDPLPTAPKEMDPKTSAGVRKILAGLGYDPDPPKKDAKPGSPTYLNALRAFQEKHPKIPQLEHGSIFGATTVWYLSHAALAIQKAEAEAKKAQDAKSESKP
jgi:3D (Asp-Asp-Asp) domain-containing protein